MLMIFVTNHELQASKSSCVAAAYGSFAEVLLKQKSKMLKITLVYVLTKLCGRLRKGFCGSIFFSNLSFFIGVFSKFTRKCQIFVHQEVDNVIKIGLYLIEFAEGRTISLNKLMAGCHRSNSHSVSAFCSISH